MRRPRIPHLPYLPSLPHLPRLPSLHSLDNSESAEDTAFPDEVADSARTALTQNSASSAFAGKFAKSDSFARNFGE
jgi:hypothetical protein